MPEDKEALMAALIARAKPQTSEIVETPKTSRAANDASEQYRHFVDDLNRSSERDMQLAELRC